MFERGWFLAPSATAMSVSSEADASEYKTVALLALAAFLCCACMGGPLVHMVSFVGSICSPTMGATSLLIAMIFGAVGRVCFGVAADRLGALSSYAMASATQTVSVLLFPALGKQPIFYGPICGVRLRICRQHDVPIVVRPRCGAGKPLLRCTGAVMMIAWAGMASSSYFSGRLFDMTLSYNLSFIFAAIAGTLNLGVLALIGRRQRAALRASIGAQSSFKALRRLPKVFGSLR